MNYTLAEPSLRSWASGLQGKTKRQPTSPLCSLPCYGFTNPTAPISAHPLLLLRCSFSTDQPTTGAKLDLRCRAANSLLTLCSLTCRHFRRWPLMLPGLAPLAYENIKKKNALGCALISKYEHVFFCNHRWVTRLHCVAAQQGLKERRASATTATVHTNTLTC